MRQSRVVDLTKQELVVTVWMYRRLYLFLKYGLYAGLDHVAIHVHYVDFVKKKNIVSDIVIRQHNLAATDHL